MDKCLKLIIAYLLLQNIAANASGQKITIVKIVVLSKQDSLPVQFSTVYLKTNTSTIVSTVTNSNGECSFKIRDSLLSIVHIYTKPIGYKEYTLPNILSQMKGDLIEIFLEKESFQLKEVLVVSKQISLNEGKIIYRVKQDKFSTSVVTTELFTKLPGVTIVSGTVKLNNRNGVLILIDGKGELASQTNQLATLTSLSSDQVERIEIDHFPSARYDASVTAVINVITKKEKNFSNVRKTLSQPIYRDESNFGNKYISGGIATNLNFKINNIRTSLVLSASSNRYPENYTQDETIYNYQSFRTISNSNYSGYYLSPKVIFDYDLNNRSSINLSADIHLVPSFTHNANENYTFFRSTINYPDSIASVINRYSNSSVDYQIASSYKLITNKKLNSTVNYNIIYLNNPYQIINNLTKTSDSQPQSEINNTLNSNRSIVNNSVIFSDFLKKQYLSTEFGFKSNILKNETHQKLNTSTTQFSYNEKISSVFFSSKWNYKTYLMVAELRGELLNSQTVVTQNGILNSLAKNYFKVYPHLLFQDMIGKDFTISIGYIKNIKRPRLLMLNPSILLSSYYSSITGNIQNQPEYFDRLELQALYKDLNLSLFYEKDENQIFLIPGNSDIYNYQNTNLGTLNKFGISLSRDLNLSKWLSSNTTVNFSKTKNQNSIVNYYRNTWYYFDVTSSIDFTLNTKSRLQINMFYVPNQNQDFIIYGKQFYNTVTFRRLMYKGNLTMNISVDDGLGIQKSRYRSLYSNLTTNQMYLTNSRLVTLQLVYKFPFGQKFKNQTYKKKNEDEIRN